MKNIKIIEEVKDLYIGLQQGQKIVLDYWHDDYYGDSSLHKIIENVFCIILLNLDTFKTETFCKINNNYYNINDKELYNILLNK